MKKSLILLIALFPLSFLNITAVDKPTTQDAMYAVATVTIGVMLAYLCYKHYKTPVNHVVPLDPNKSHNLENQSSQQSSVEMNKTTTHFPQQHNPLQQDTQKASDKIKEIFFNHIEILNG